MTDLRPLVDLSDAPDTPLERIAWLSGLQQRLDHEVEVAWRKAYFDARLQGVLPQALDLGFHARKTVMRWIRNENEARGRIIQRWGDGLS